MEYLSELGVFTGKTMIATLAIGSLLILLFALIAKARKIQVTLTVENLNKKYEGLAQALREAVWDPKQAKLERKAQKKRDKQRDADRKRIYVLDFQGDIRASHVENLREEITSLLTILRPERDEVVVRVESPGGMVHTYGLAATQLIRLRQAGVQVTVCVDKVAASGGYMIACTANRIVAAPFAIIGSIGVVAQIPNFHRLLKKHDIDYNEYTAGEFKRTVSLLGEITEKGRRKFLDQIEDTHGMFKAFVKQYRPQLELEKVATGEYWHGQQALELNLVDELAASDDYLFRRREEADIYSVKSPSTKKWSEKLAENIARLTARLIENSSQIGQF